MSLIFPARTAGSILLKSRADDDRIITHFPQPFKISATSYEEEDFGPNVKASSESYNHAKPTELRSSKVVIVGDFAVGKTSLVNRFCHKTFDPNYKATIGVDFEVERFDVLGQPFNLQIWDTTGQEKFQSLMPAYYRRANVIILTFDLKRLYSLHTISHWLDVTLQNNGNTHPPLLFLVGTKLDLLSKASYFLMEKDAIKLASAMKAEYWAVSSKTDENVKEFFFRVTALAFSRCVLAEFDRNVAETKENSVKLFDIKNKEKNSHRNRSCGKCMSNRSTSQ